MKLIKSEEKMDSPKISGQNTNVCEALIDNKRVAYDACSKSDLEAAKTIYSKSWKYIGSGNEIFVNGNPNLSKDWYHFFVRTSDDDFDTEPNL